MSYKVGQVVYTTNTGTGGSVIQGVQMAYEIFTVGVNETTLDISLTVFPNPTDDKLTLWVTNFSDENTEYQVYDTQGKFLFTGKVNSNQTFVDMRKLPSAISFMHERYRNEVVQAFKIIKNH